MNLENIMLIEGSQLGEAPQFHLLEMSRKGKIIGTKKKAMKPWLPGMGTLGKED